MKGIVSTIFVFLLYLSVNKADKLKDLEKLVNELKDRLDLVESESKSITSTTDSDLCGDDWISYSDTKCFKVLDTKGSEVEAKEKCSQLDSSSTLMTIGSEDEQQFINGLMKNYNGIYDNIWIGMEFVDNYFQWLDETELNYENWDENADRDGHHICVKMSISGVNIGKWSDDDCWRKYLVACEKKPSSKTFLQHQIDNLTKVIERQQGQITSLLKNTVPIGFIYHQLPGQSSPQDIWPGFEWTTVSANYSGLFFRVEDENASTFGQIQDDQGHSISIKADKLDILKSHWFLWSQQWIRENEVAQSGKFIVTGISGEPSSYVGIQLKHNNEEIRPRNQAIRIWKRIN